MSDPMDLEMATTAILADNRDTRELLKLLARQLAGALGPRVEVERQGRLRKTDEVKTLSVSVGSEDFVATVDRGGVETAVAHKSGGIRIRTEQVTADVWLRRLLEELRKEAETNQAARLVIEGLVMGSD
jgi:hypothetical protein